MKKEKKHFIIEGDGARESALTFYLKDTASETYNTRYADLVVIGPDHLLAEGRADDYLMLGIPVFGPTKKLARLESSKAYAYELMKFLGIKTPASHAYHSPERIWQTIAMYQKAHGQLPVLKRDGLARGKGVLVSNSKKEMRRFIDAHFQENPNMALLASQRINGPELSLHALCDGKRYVLLPPAMDYKRAQNGNRGGMTGGMGCIGSHALINQTTWEELGRKFIQPILKHSAKTDRRGFRGCLYAGLIKHGNEWMALEYNVRFGDPETQALLPLLTQEPDLFDLLLACANGRLHDVVEKEQLGKVLPHQGHTVVVTLADKDYPNRYNGPPISYAKGNPIFFDGDELMEFIFPGAKKGRVASLGGYSQHSIEEARERSYRCAARVNDVNTRYRTDIAKIVPVL